MILSGVIAALSGASLMAQVYSLNAVGYINVTCAPGFSIIADQLYASNSVTPQYISPLLDAQLLIAVNSGEAKKSPLDSRQTPDHVICRT